MGDYHPPVAGLLKLGEMRYGGEWADYTAFGIGPEHIPELIRLVRDEALAHGDGEKPEVYAQVHAWRALAQLRAEAAIEPLLDLLTGQDGEDWDDWLTEEVPRVLGMIGPAALRPTVARLENRGRQVWPPTYFARTLTEIAQHHPQARAEVVRELSRVLDTAAENDPGVNGSVVANLLDLEAVEAWPAIERAFATGNVDPSIAGDAELVKYELGLGPEPPPRRFDRRPPAPSGGTNAKQRFNERQRKKKLEKKARKNRRKGK